MAIILILLKASALLVAALLGARILRGAPAATRHALWSVTFAALLALPALDATVPSMRVPVPDAWAAAVPGPTARPASDEILSTTDASHSTANVTLPTSDLRVSRREQAPSSVAAPPAAGVDRRSIGTVVRLVWLAGALAAAGALLLSLLRVRRLTHAATDVTDPAWREAADTIGARLAIRRPARVLVSDAVRTPMAGGVWRPLIFLPADAASWTAERRDVVLAHELSHIARRDPLRHLAARFAVACYWFHPLAWLAARQSSLAREQACDEAVLALGVRPSDYARVLLDLAETMAPPRGTAAALPMVERSLLETRLMAILDHGIRPSRQSFIPAVAAALLAVALAAAQPAARAIPVQSPLTAASAADVAPVAPIAPTSSIEPIASVASTASIAATAPAQTSLYTTCWLDSDRSSSFSGYTNTDERGSIRERVGTNNGTLIIQQHFGDTRVCMVAEGDGTNDREMPTAWAARAPRVIIETARGGSRARLDILRHAGGTQTRWRVNDTERPFDAAAQAWRDAVLAVLDRTWEISTLRGEESTLRGQISTTRGEESTLRGEISTLRGDISTMRGRQSTIRGEESTLRGEISQIEGQVSTLRGQISTEQGAISSLTASRYASTDADRQRLADQLKAHEDEIVRLERELRDYGRESQIAAVEKQIRALDADAKIAAIDTEIRKFDEAGKIAAIEKQIQALNVDGKTAELERRIQALDVDRRTRQLQSVLDEAVTRLERALAAIR